MRELKTYQGAWHTRIRVHAIEDVRLPFALDLQMFGVFLALELIILFLHQLFPFLFPFPFLTTYGVIPGVLTWVLMRVRADGKPLLLWVWGWIAYRFRPHCRVPGGWDPIPRGRRARFRVIEGGKGRES